jgi:RNA polymerase sigma factor (sigma-70 family)
MGAEMVEATRRPFGDLDVLVPAAARGDAEAWTSLTERFTSLVWAVARSYRLNESDAADVVQNTWLRLLDNVTRIQHPAALPKWLKTTASREALAVLRRRDVVTDMTDPRMDHPDEGQPSLDALLLDDERDAHLWSCFRQLSERDQRLLRVLMVSDVTAYADVALVLDMPVGSIGPTRMRALAKLRQLLVASGYVFDGRDHGFA